MNLPIIYSSIFLYISYSEYTHLFIVAVVYVLPVVARALVRSLAGRSDTTTSAVSKMKLNR